MFFALQALYSSACDVHIEIQCDNVAAVTYLNEMGGMASLDMDRLATDIWDWCLERNIFVSAIYIPGKLNVHADFYSRNFSNST